MYIPHFNKFEGQHKIVAFMQRYSFATVISVNNNLPVATHLPFLVKHTDDKIILSSHFAKANPQCADIIDRVALVIFSEPHAYISPRNYEKVQNVPTWNYLAVHAYGKCVLLDSEESKAELLKETILNYESDYLKQWDNLPDDYKHKMMKGIVAFQIEVTDLQAKAKLSQNRTENEQENIVAELYNKTDPVETAIAGYMTDLKSK